MREKVRVSDRVHAAIGANRRLEDCVRVGKDNRLVVQHHRGGKLLWEGEVFNLVTDQGKDHSHDVTLLGAAQVATWYLALIDTGGALAAGDTYAAHAGWAENDNYDEAARPTWIGADDGVGASTNSANKAVFTISAGGATVAGVAFVSNNTKGDSAAAGAVLYSESLFQAERPLQAGDTLTVQYDQSHA